MSSDVDGQDTPRGQYLTTRQAAELLMVHPVTMAQWRQKGRGPKYTKVGDAPKARIRYRVADIYAWMRQYNVSPKQGASTRRGAA